MLISFKDDVVTALKKKRPSSAQVDRERLHEKLQESQERRRRRRQLATSSRLASHNRSVVPLGLFLLFFYTLLDTLFNENPPINIPRFSRRRSSSSNGCSVKQANLTVSWQPSEVVLSAGLGLGLFACIVAV